MIPQELSSWRQLWDGGGKIPFRGGRGLLGWLGPLLSQLLRPFTRIALREQRFFNLFLIETLERVRGDVASLDRARAELHRDLLQVRGDLLEDVQQHARRLDHLEGFDREVFGDLMVHNDALFARLDQKLDRYRHDSRDLMGRLGALLVVAEQGPAALARGSAEQDYLGLEERFRGAEADIAERLSLYLPYLRGGGTVLDLGCGRGEALAVLRAAGIDARGVDGSIEMVRRCREAGLPASEEDLFAVLVGQPEASLRGVVSFHVIEHLPAESIRQLVRLAWRALARGGVLILETPNPLSLVVAARNFWLDPTHRRPVHPSTLQLLFEQAGFEEIERLDLRPFSAAERLPEIDLAALPSDLAGLGHQLNLLRDGLDELLFGTQDYAMVGRKA